VFAPAFVHEPDGAECAAPFESVNPTATCSPAAGTKVPVPVSFDNVTVNDCDAPTSAVVDGEIAICPRTAPAANHVLSAIGESPGSPSPVTRVSDTPPTFGSATAAMDVVPAVVDLITIGQDPVPFTVVQLLEATNVPVAPPEFEIE